MLCPQIQKLQSAGGGGSVCWWGLWDSDPCDPCCVHRSTSYRARGGVVSVGGVRGTLIRVVSTDPEATERGGGGSVCWWGLWDSDPCDPCCVHRSTSYRARGGVVSVGGVRGTLIRVVSTDPEATERGGGGSVCWWGLWDSDPCDPCCVHRSTSYRARGGVVSVGGVRGTLIRVVSTDPEATERGGGGSVCWWGLWDSDPCCVHRSRSYRAGGGGVVSVGGVCGTLIRVVSTDPQATERGGGGGSVCWWGLWDSDPCCVHRSRSYRARGGGSVCWWGLWDSDPCDPCCVHRSTSYRARGGVVSVGGVRGTLIRVVSTDPEATERGGGVVSVGGVCGTLIRVVSTDPEATERGGGG